MSATHNRAIAALNQLVKLSHNSEAGFRVTAENVNNRGLKTLLKAYAKQRALFAEELHAEVIRLGGVVKKRRSVLGMTHRGWILIKASLTLGEHNVEQVVLAEAHRGERYAQKQYKQALQQELPAATHALLERHYETLQAVGQQIFDMAVNPDYRLVVRLFNSDADVDKAENALQEAGFSQKAISTMVFNTAVSQYQINAKRSTVLEMMAIGSLGGAVMGGLVGLMMGLGIWLMPSLGMSSMTGSAPINTVGILIVIGAVIGALFMTFAATLMGLSASEQDAYLYDDSLKNGQTLLMVFTDPGHADEAADIMHQVNLARFG